MTTLPLLYSKAAVVLRPGRSATGEQIREHARGCIAGCTVPQVVHVVDNLPTTANAKPDRRALRAAAEQRYQRS